MWRSRPVAQTERINHSDEERRGSSYRRGILLFSVERFIEVQEADHRAGIDKSWSISANAQCAWLVDRVRLDLIYQHS